MASVTVTPIAGPVTIQAWQLSSTSIGNVGPAFKNAANLGYECNLSVVDDGSPAAPTFTYTLTDPQPADTVPDQGWVVSDGIQVQVYTNLQFTELYTLNTALVWDPTTTAPTATAQSGGEAAITFPQPTSANGPWTYTVSQTNVTTTTTGPATLVGSPAVDSSGNVTLTVSGLTSGDSYTFTVTVNTQYSGVTATSLATSAITAKT